MSLKGWAIAVVGVGAAVLTLAMSGGLLTGQQVDNVMANLSDAAVFVMIHAMERFALPVIVGGVFFLLTHGWGMMSRIVIGGLIFAAAAGLTNQGAWSAIQAQSGDLGHFGGNIVQRLTGLLSR